MDFIKHYMLPTLIKASKKAGIIVAIAIAALFQLITIIVCPFPWDIILIIVYGIIDYTCVTSYEQYKEDQKRINNGLQPLYRK
jgi:hypothetical protein